MRSEIGKRVKAIFSERVRERFPYFSAVEPTGALQGGLLYKWQVSSEVCCFIYLQLSRKMYQDCFMVELSCSSADFPLHLLASDPNNVHNGAVRFRLPELYRDEWRHKSKQVPWWWIGREVRPHEITERALTQLGRGKQSLTNSLELPVDEALPLVEPQVEDAIRRIEKYGINYFRNFAGEKTT
jgi:hypothetical protein